MKRKKLRSVEILAEFKSGERVKPIGISIERGFALFPMKDDPSEHYAVKFGEIALVMVEDGKESYVKFK